MYEIHGVIEDSSKSCRFDNPQSCTFRYKVRGKEGSVINVSAGPNDIDIAQNLSPGTNIEKNYWALDYKINGKIDDKFPITLYSLILLIGVILFVQGIYLVPFKNVLSKFKKNIIWEK